MTEQEVLQRYKNDPAFRGAVRARAPQQAAILDRYIQSGQQSPQPTGANGSLGLAELTGTPGLGQNVKDIYNGISGMFSSGPSEPVTGGMSMPTPDGLGGMSVEGSSQMPISDGGLLGNGQGLLGSNSWSQFGQGGTGGMLADGSGVLTAGLNMYDAFGNIKDGDRKGVTEGLATTAGTALGSFFGPVGAGVGSVVGRTLGRGLNSGLKRLGVHGWTPSLREKNTDEARNLAKKYNTHYTANDLDMDKQTLNQRGQVDSAYAPDYVGMTDTGWINNKFAKSRNVGDLRAEDVWGMTDNYNMFGNDYLGATSEAQRRQLADMALQQGLIGEGKGKVYVKDKDKYKSLWDEVISGKQSAYPAKSDYKNLSNLMYKPPGSKYGEGGPSTSSAYAPDRTNPTGPMLPVNNAANDPVASRYGADVAKQVAAAQAAGRNVGVGGAGMRWDGKNFVRR